MNGRCGYPRAASPWPNLMTVLCQQLDTAILMSDEDAVVRLLREMTGWSIRRVGFDPAKAVVYVSVQDERRVYGSCARVVADQLVTIAEHAAPAYVGAPRELLEDLDPTFDIKAIRWRRDCMLMVHRRMVMQAELGHPYWTALYSPTPLCVLGRDAHVGVLLDSGTDGLVDVAATDGRNFRVVRVSLEDLAAMRSLPRLEWDGDYPGILASKGAGDMHYVGVGPPDFRVGMLFNDGGGLLAWSGAATHCDMMAAMAQAPFPVFAPAQLLRQLQDWQGLTLG